MIQHYLKIAFRNLFRHKTQNAISILGIAIGFTAFLLGGYWYYWEHSFDTFHPDSEHTYTITTSGVMQEVTKGADTELQQLHESVEKEIAAFPEIRRICHISALAYQSEGKEKSWMGMNVDSLFFSLFQCRLIEGSYRQVPFDAQSVILTQKMATYLFGDSTCVGKRVKVSKQKYFTVAGVMTDYPQNSDFKFDLFLKEYIWLALLGNAVALPLGCLFIQRWLETYAYHVPFQAWLLPLVFIITCSIVVLSVTRQVLLATKANPVDAIKE